MLRKVVLMCLISILFTFSSVQVHANTDFKPGLLYGKPTTDGRTALTDGDLATFITLPGTTTNAVGEFVLEFDEPISLFRIYQRYKSDSAPVNPVYSFFNSSGQRVLRKGFNQQGFINLDTTLYDIKRIQFSSNTNTGVTQDLQMFDVYSADYQPPPYVPPPIGEVRELKSVSQHDQVQLSWELPYSDKFKEIRIYKNGGLLTSTTGTSYVDEDVVAGQTYVYKITSVSTEDAESAGTEITENIPLPPPLEDVSEVAARATFDTVYLSWALPQDERLKHVNIYRAAETNGEIAIMAAPTKIFETNGTYFNDLTVQPETTYNYRLTTYSTEGVESEGVEKTVTTLEAPPPVIEGGSYTKDPLTGNFIYSWESPSYGQVRVMLGEDLFATVDASLKKVSIPNNQMKYTPFGDPDITLIAVDGDKESDPVRPGKDGQESGDTLDQLKVPFTAQDLLDSGAGLFLIIGPFLLLSLAFLLVPKFRAAVMTAFNGKGEKDEVVKDGRSEREGRSYRENASDRNLRVPREKVERETRAPRQARGERG